MIVAISYETALARHPAAVAEVLAMLRKSRSKDLDCDPTHFAWTYSWGISGQCISLGELLAGRNPVETRSLEERIGSVSLYAEKGRKYAYSDRTYDYARDGAEALPPEVRAYHCAERHELEGS